ncbi:flagellar motor protein MotB [Alkalimarinus sediminis]|uniref:OmpA family protein n=1 Tax=Alkalimarinus sediminis TaxID=1632866 RepID=A0A9E8KP48_9ALTE|nr:flagellar motor protein MotB [Alkalimarinus sediminis]UZW75053.1 OmpA family protein [Alkalimarinus sediminis]
MRAIAKKQKKSTGGTGWIVTFADLMTLLLTFFILLLSFSSMDTEKYKAIAQSMAVSFGVSWIQGEQTGGQLTLIDSDMVPPPTADKEVVVEETIQPPTPQAPTIVDEVVQEQPTPVVIDPGLEGLAEDLIQALEKDIVSNAIDVSFDSEKVIVRFSSEASFTSGSDELKDGMLPIINKIVSALARCEGDIVVSGYTDNQPITSGRFRSNWDLSAARAVSVVHQLVLEQKIDANRVMAAGHAETNPLVENDTPENRSKNRRVEIKIFNPECDEGAFSF